MVAKTNGLRARHVGVRLNEAEHAVLASRAQAAGYAELSAYVRVVALRNQAPKERKVPQVNFDTWGKLGKLTRNLEELHEYLGRGGVIDQEQGEQLTTVLRAVSAEIGEVRVLLLGGTAEDLAE